MKHFVLAAILAVSSLSAHAAELYNNGPVVNASGRSVLDPDGDTLGFGNQLAAGLSVADHFSIASGQSWNVSSLDFFAYQTGANGFTFQNASWSIISGDVNAGTVVASGLTALTNGGLQGYRVSDLSQDNTQRAIYLAQADVADFTLDAGQYWLRWSLSGSGTSGPWVAPTSDGRVGDAVQSQGASGYSSLYDGGTGQGVALPFALHGTVISAVPEPQTYAMLLAGLCLLGAAARRRTV